MLGPSLVQERVDSRLLVLGPLVGRLSIEGSPEELDCKPFEVSNGGLAVWTKVPLPLGTMLCLRTGDSAPGREFVRLKVRYCLRNHMNTELYRCGLVAVGTKIDFFGEREGLKIIPTQVALPASGDTGRAFDGGPGGKHVTRTQAALHDARNYLLVAHCAADILTMAKAESANIVVSDFAKKILKAVDHLAHCIEEIEDDQRSLFNETWVPLIPKTLVEDAVDLVRGVSDRYGVPITVEPIPETSARVLGMPKALIRVIMNLMVNAMDAARRHEDRWVRVTVLFAKGKAQIRIADSGTIAADLRDKVFAAFFTTKANERETSGIGLTVAQAVIAQHGGSVYLDHKAPTTTFVVELPLEKKGPA